MMLESEKSKFVRIASGWSGYLEKVNYDYKYYESKTDNAGRGNYSRFGRIADMMLSGRDSKNKDGYSWCAMFVLACLYETYGGVIDTRAERGKLAVRSMITDKVKQELYAGYSYGWQYYAGVDVFLKAFKKMNKITKTPDAGDLVVFIKGGSAYHIGIVTGVNSGSVTTVEGNTSISGNDIVANGGAVAIKRRQINENTLFLSL